MKNIWQAIVNFCIAFGTARAASILARQGNHEEAKRLFEK
jgi:hypothetical protein